MLSFRGKTPRDTEYPEERKLIRCYNPPSIQLLSTLATMILANILEVLTSQYLSQ